MDIQDKVWLSKAILVQSLLIFDTAIWMHILVDIAKIGGGVP